MVYSYIFLLVAYLLAGFVYVIKRTTDEVMDNGPADVNVVASLVAQQIEHGDDNTAKWLFFWPAYLTAAAVKFIIFKIIHLFISLKKKEA